MIKKFFNAVMAFSVYATSSMAATNITFWHGMGGS